MLRAFAGMDLPGQIRGYSADVPDGDVPKLTIANWAAHRRTRAGLFPCWNWYEAIHNCTRPKTDDPHKTARANRIGPPILVRAVYHTISTGFSLGVAAILRVKSSVREPCDLVPRYWV